MSIKQKQTKRARCMMQIVQNGRSDIVSLAWGWINEKVLKLWTVWNNGYVNTGMHDCVDMYEGW